MFYYNPQNERRIMHPDKGVLIDSRTSKIHGISCISSFTSNLLYIYKRHLLLYIQAITYYFKPQ